MPSEPTSNGDTVRGYIERGWKPIPLKSNDKAPRDSGWQTNEYDPEDFRDGDNVGLRLGPTSGNIMDVDLDSPEAVALARNFLPLTGAIFGRESKRRSHYLYEVTAEQLRRKVYEDPEGGVLLEVRGGGHQTMVPPSVHPHGENVAWDSDGDPARLPLADLLKHTDRHAAASLIARHWNAWEHKHHMFALAFAGWRLRAGDTEDDVLTFLKAVCDYAGDPDWADKEKAIQTTADKIRDGLDVVGFPRLVETIGEPIANKLAEWLPTGNQAPKKFTIYTVDEFRNKPRPEYIIGRVVQERSLVMVYGGFATFKTFNALDMGLSASLGLSWHGFPSKAVPVLYIVGEGGGQFAKRIDAWMKYRNIPDVPDFYILPDAPQLNTERDLTALIEAVNAFGVSFGMICIDTLARTFSGNENAQEDMNLYINAAAELQKLGAAVVVIHHTGKDGRYRGSSNLPGAVETIIRIDRKNGGVRITNEKQKDDDEFKPFVLKKQVVALGDLIPDPDSDVIDLGVPTSLVFVRDDSAPTERDDLTPAQRKVLTVLSDAGIDGLTHTAWLNTYGGPKTTFTDAKDLLIDRGYVTTPDRGRKGARFTVTPTGTAILENPDSEGENDDAA